MPITTETTDHEIEDAISQRLERATLIYDNTKTFRFVMGEAALRYWYCPSTVMRSQYTHLNMVADLPNVEIGIIPFATPLPTIMLNAFTIFDGLVAVETRTTEARYHPDSNEAAVYAQAANDLWSQAITGTEVQTLIQKLAAELPPTDDRPPQQIETP